MAISRSAAAAIAVLTIAVALGAIFVGCGGIAVQPVKLADPIELAGPVELSDKPVVLDALRIDQTVPISIQQPVPITIGGPITIQLQGPSVEYQGTYVSEAMMERIQVGQTDAEWLLAVVGEPESRHPMSDGTELWKWVYRPSAGQAPLVDLLGQTDKRPDPQPITAYVRLKEGIVVDKWRG